MRVFDLDVNNVKKIVYDENLMNVELNDNGELIFYGNIKGDVIDSNFTELDKRLSDVESQMRLRFLGEIQRLRSENETLLNRISSLEAKYIKEENNE